MHFLKSSCASAFVPRNTGSSPAPEATLWERLALPRGMHRHFCGDALAPSPLSWGKVGMGGRGGPQALLWHAALVTPTLTLPRSGGGD